MTRHRTDVLSLAFGLVFLAFGIAGLTDLIGPGILDVDWLWPALLLLGGVAILLTISDRPDDQAPDVPEQPASVAWPGAADEVAGADDPMPAIEVLLEEGRAARADEAAATGPTDAGDGAAGDEAREPRSDA